MYPCRLHGLSAHMCTRGIFFPRDYGGRWILQNMKEEFSPLKKMSRPPGLGWRQCRHAPNSCMLTYITRIQVTQFHILPVQTLSNNTQSEIGHLEFFFFSKENCDLKQHTDEVAAGCAPV